MDWSLQHVKIVEVGPRDGLQNEPRLVPTAEKLELIEKLCLAHLPTIEVTAFVSPRRVPQMSDHSEVLRRVALRAGVRFPVLVPNMLGFQGAQAAGAREIAVFTAASETFSQKNTHCSIEESFERIEQVCAQAQSSAIAVRGYVSCVLGCPYEGEVQVSAVQRVARRLWDLGCYEISLGDTIGVGTPARAQSMFRTVAEAVPLERLAGHFHDTYGQALANIYACLELGVRTFDSSVAGLGGCPYAPGAGGNVATEDLIYMLDGMGVQTGVDLQRVLDAADYICRVLGRETDSRVARALNSRRQRE
jgi:isopropylmalate/homocitrate/citramalate synthase